MANSAATKTATKPKGEGLFARFIKFIRESWYETFKKSSWPTRTELRQFTVVVIFTIVAIAVYIGAIDFILTKVTEAIPKG
ncbi:MAG: preprotein translocase subunit SecE [Armatimonadota bacterium]|nr:preprotein translocase subunit SecE [bacterium]